MTPTAKKAPATKAPAKKAPVKKVAAKTVVSKKSVAKKASASKPVAKKLVAKKAVKSVPVKKAPAKPVASATKKSAPIKKVAERSPNIVKPTLAKKAAPKKGPAKPFPAKLQSTTTGDSTTITVTPREVNTGPEVVIEERRLVMPPPPRPVKSGKRAHTLKPIKGAPAPLVVNESENPWTAAELKAMRTELAKELVRLKSELSEAEGEMEDLISAAGVGAGDDQADAGTKTFEREHEMSLVYNARDMVLQTERAIERIDKKTYGRCEECGNAIGKARLQVFPRATLCMSCKQKEERR
jgi:RNA polymerase-binding transcription factor DksA